MGRDSSKPRGKTSPYGFFVKMCYEEHKKKYPNENVQVTEISKKCSEKWKTMAQNEKQRFFELAQKDAERYQQEIQSYGGGDDGGKKRKRGTKKDPNAPKRALSAFFCFSQTKRSEVNQAHPEWKVGQVAQELGRQWKDLTDVQKKEYEAMASRDKSRYEAEMLSYKTGNKAPPARGKAAVGMDHGASSSAPMMMQHHDEDDVDDEDDDDDDGDD